MPVSKKRKIKQKRTSLKPLQSKYQGLIKETADRLGHDTKVIMNPPGEEKMSEVMLKFIEPYHQFATDDAAEDNLIKTAIMAWNMSLVPEKENTILLKEGCKGMSRQVAEDFKHITAELIARKKKHFAHYKRAIINYQITRTNDSNSHFEIYLWLKPQAKSSSALKRAKNVTRFSAFELLALGFNPMLSKMRIAEPTIPSNSLLYQP